MSSLKPTPDLTKFNFSGVIAPVLTPFGEDGAPDPERFVEHAEWLMSNGCTALAPFGTTSEANSLGLDERMEMLEELVDAGINPARLMPGTGMCSTTDTVILTQHAVDLGCGGTLVLPPFYYKGVTDEGLYRFYSDVIDMVSDDRLRMYLYHIPPIAQVGLSLDLIDRLRKAFPETVVGLKDSSGDWNNMKAILERFPGFELFMGAEVHMLAGLRGGAAGVISASANVACAPMRDLFDNWQGAGADEKQAKIAATRTTIQSVPMMPLLKAIVAHYRKDPAWAELRPPLTALPEADAERVIKILADQHGLKLDMDVEV
jgi:4-hydroxy-tetrahydrodipicolinate synthase